MGRRIFSRESRELGGIKRGHNRAEPEGNLKPRMARMTLMGSGPRMNANWEGIGRGQPRMAELPANYANWEEWETTDGHGWDLSTPHPGPLLGRGGEGDDPNGGPRMTGIRTNMEMERPRITEELPANYANIPKSSKPKNVPGSAEKISVYLQSVVSVFPGLSRDSRATRFA